MKPTPPDPRSPREPWAEQYQLLQNNPLPWLLKADQLIEAFEALIVDDERRASEGRSRRIDSVTYLLAGFAMEALLKGLLIAAKKHLDARGRFRIATHDLRKLAIDAGYDLDRTELTLLERIEQFTTWTARYPMPLSVDDLRPRQTADGGFAPRTYHYQGEDRDPIRALIRRFKEDLTVRL